MKTSSCLSANHQQRVLHRAVAQMKAQKHVPAHDFKLSSLPLLLSPARPEERVGEHGIPNCSSVPEADNFTNPMGMRKPSRTGLLWPSSGLGRWRFRPLGAGRRQIDTECYIHIYIYMPTAQDSSCQVMLHPQYSRGTLL